MRLLTPHSYGARFQNRLAKSYGWTVVPARLDRGDIQDAEGHHWEVKVTMITPSNPGVNFVQIRPHQDIAGYHCFVVQPDFSLVHLTLTSAQMSQELTRLGTSAHGTTSAVEVDTTREYAIRFPWTPGSGTAQEWLTKYQQTTPTLV